jgi:hypothetical protein
LTKIKKTLKYTSLAEQNGKAKTKKFFNNESRQSVWALASTLSEAKRSLMSECQAKSKDSNSRAKNLTLKI